MPFKNPHPLYQCWQGMRQRCRNPNLKQWPDYGGRGISIDPVWDVFERFASDMGPKPTPAHTLDRIDNDKDYGPDNCRWATRLEQARNQRTTRRVVVEGQEYLVADLSRRYGIKHDTIAERAAKGMAFADVVTKQKHTSTRVPIEAIAAAQAKRAARTHCKYGHEFTAENTYTPAHKPNQRNCRACHNAKMLARNIAKRSINSAMSSAS